MKSSPARPGPTIHIATSSGGHIDLLAAVRSAFSGYDRVWVVQPSLRAELLSSEGEDVHVLPDYDRHPIRGHFAQNILHAARLVLRQRPKVIVTSGAGITVPFCLFARLTGAKIIFVETMARVTGPSASGKVLSRLAHTVLVQWPEAAGCYPRAKLCQPALLRAVSRERKSQGRGVFVAVGTHSEPFDRLLQMVDRAVGGGTLPPPVIAQSGVGTYEPRHYGVRDFIPPGAVSKCMENAEYVVCHAGSGLISAALRAGRRPLVLPRLARHGEHFDDHQTQIVAKLAQLGLVVAIEDRITEQDLAAARLPLPEQAEAVEPTVEVALRSELELLLGPPESEPQPTVAPKVLSGERRIA